MIALLLSEAYCYDMLAIAYVKAVHVDTPDLWKEYHRLEQLIEVQVDVKGFKHEDVVRSQEYETLHLVNAEMFHRINLMKTRPATGEDALYIDDRVYARFKAKQALQARWFPDTPLTETKHGYKESGS